MQNGGAKLKTPEQLKILILAAEVVPFAKVGGLADVVGALPKALRELGHDVRVVMPRYGQVKPDQIQIDNCSGFRSCQHGDFQRAGWCMPGRNWRWDSSLYD